MTDVVDSLTSREIYDVQVGLRAMKECGRCYKYKPMGQFYPPNQSHPSYALCCRCIDYLRTWEATRRSQPA